MKGMFGLLLVVAAGCAATADSDPHLTRESLERIHPGVSRESDVRAALGAPERVQAFPRMERVTWSYPASGIQPLLLIVQFSSDGVVRETYVIDDPDFVSAAE